MYTERMCDIDTMKEEDIEVVYSPKINQWTDILLTKFKVVIWLSQSFVIR